MIRPRIPREIIYGITLAISTWFIAIRSPLFLDETDSYWQISHGFSGLWASQFSSLSFPAYPLFLWLWTRVLGTSEITMRVLSLVAMLGAAYMLYRAARELFDRETSLLAVLVFCVHPIIVFASINVRPYAFAALAITSAFFVLFRLRRCDSNWLAALFGALSASIVYFSFLFVAILPALLLCFFILKSRGTPRWRQFGSALAACSLAFLPLIPGLLYLLRTRGTHVYEKAPKISQLLWTVAPSWLPVVFAGAVLMVLVIAALTTQPGKKSRRSPERPDWRPIAVCVLLGFVPLLILYGVSAATPLHMFTEIHRIVAVPGIALCWAIVVSRFRTEVRALFAITLASVITLVLFRSADARQPEASWKYAVQAVEKNASIDNAPVLVCSNYPESDYATFPIDSPKTSHLLAPLSYYKLSVPVVALPRGLNAGAMRVGSQFLDGATARQRRFFAMGDPPSYKTLNWLGQRSSGTYTVRKVGVFGITEVLEFDPRPERR